MVNRNLKQNIHQNVINVNEKREKYDKYNKNWKYQNQQHNNYPIQSNAQIPPYMPAEYNQFDAIQQEEHECHTQTESCWNKFDNFFSCADNAKSDNDDDANDADASDKSKPNVYCFDHGDCGYLRTTDNAPQLKADIASKRVFNMATRFWAEVFGFLNVGVTFFVVFFLQLYR